MIITYECGAADVFEGDVRFIGMNTADGFRWSRDGIPGERDVKRTYIIKGAAGTGKSTLMKNVADRFENDGVPVVRFLCSSDPGSLDAVLIDGSVLILDGTAPHVRDAGYPGALSELVCLGNFWSRDKLIGNSGTIVRLSDEKSRCFKKAYRFMAGMSKLSDAFFEDAERSLDVQKTEKAMSRIVGKLKKSESQPEFIEKIVRAFGMRGAVRLPTFERKASTVVTVSDLYGTGRVFLTKLADKLRSAGIPFDFSPDPLFSGKLSEIFIPADGLLLTVDKTEKTEKFLNMDRFVDREKLAANRGEIRLAYKCWDALRQDAERELRRAAEYHFELERIYGSAMNFEAVSAYGKLLIKEIENRL